MCTAMNINLVSVVFLLIVHFVCCADVFPLHNNWKLPEADRQWVSRALFSGSEKNPVFDRDRVDRLWWYPPQPMLRVPQCPRRADAYFASRLFLWMPLKLWGCELHCPDSVCSQLSPKPKLTQCGIYHTVKKVLDVDGWYSMAGEYLECRQCKGKVTSWHPGVLAQLDIGHRLQFPAIMMYQYACDFRVIRMLRQRGLGNGPMQLIRKLREQHSEAWLTKVALLMTHIKPFCSSDALGIQLPPLEPPAMVAVPGHKWLLSVYCVDVLQRLPEVKAAITSTFGNILKMDSTKKVCGAILHFISDFNHIPLVNVFSVTSAFSILK